MHASSIVALALGATVASAATFPNLKVREAQVCDPYCQFPESIDCPVRNGVHVLKKNLVDAVRNGNRAGDPREKDANNLATTHCSDQKFRGIPLWIVSLSLERDGESFTKLRMLTFTFADRDSRWSNGFSG
jgi:hypothetical protein